MGNVMDPCGDRIVQYLDCDDGHTKLYSWSNCIELNTYTYILG